MNKYQLAIASSLLIALSLTSGCSENSSDKTSYTPQDLTRDEVCMIDGMILLDHPGPKGQVIYKNGEPHFFCDTKGLISTLYDQNYNTKIKQAFVQDFGKRKWSSYSDNWIDVKQAFFVMGSSQFGAMGPTLATFSTRSDADAFAKEFGGSVLAFNELSEEKFEAYQKRIRQQLRDAIGNISTSNEEAAHQH
ncbi:nitrous oxide reductase accessory protein NosL [Pseudomonadota bacterium]